MHNTCQPLSEEYMGSHMPSMRKCLRECDITPLDVELPHPKCVSELLKLMFEMQCQNGYIDNALIHLFVHRAAKRTFEACRAGTSTNGFSTALCDVIFPMKPGKEDWQGVHPRVDELFALHDLVEETENELCDMMYECVNTCTTAAHALKTRDEILYMWGAWGSAVSAASRARP